MLIDLSQTIGSYLHEVFVAKFQWWVLLGYVAQIMFTMRFLVQWIASERAGKMVMPIAFWFFSIGGGVLLLLYALYIRDPVFILGQGFGVFVYARNLYFELRDRRGEVPIASRQRCAQRCAARWHPRHRLRAQGVPPRSLSGAALFRRIAPISSRAGAARRIRHRLCGRGRPAAPRRHVELRHVGSALGRDPRSPRGLVAHSSPAPGAARLGGETEC